VNAAETLSLVRMVRALCPSQKLDEFTPDAWAMVLDDVAYADAQAAVRSIYREQGSDAEWVRRIEADDIIRQVKRVRASRCEHAGDLVPPAGLSQAEEREWLRRAYRQIAAGQPAPAVDRGELKPRTIRALGHRLQETP
jgi:hypothetical protein